MSLFPDPPLTIEPAIDRSEPVVWIRRLLVVPSLAPDVEPIREMSFRLGLNIIRTADRPTGETRVIGHSVGKTLLTRLIRYCLGEAHFAVETVRNRIVTMFPTSHVLADVRVAGQTWVVVRPLQDAHSQASWAVAGDDWRAATSRPKAAIPFTEFVRQVDQASLADVPDIALPNIGRPVRWLDLLGWLARDHECRYRVYNEWREPDAQSGTGKLDRDDATFLMRLLMGLFDAHERPLIEAHRKLLADQESTKTQVGRLSRFIENTFPLLRSRLGLTEEECGQDKQFVGGLFATRASEVVTQKKRSLRQLSAELRTGSRATELYQESIKSAQAFAIAAKELERANGLKAAAEIELQKCEQSSTKEFYARFSPAVNCPAPTCPLRPPEDSSSFADPNRQTRLAELRANITRLGEDIQRLNQECTQAQRISDETRTAFIDEQTRMNRDMRGISREIGRWNVLVEQANEYEESLTKLAKAEKQQQRLDRSCKDSLAQLEAARESLANRRIRLSQYFDWTLKQLLGPEADGSINVDARGLHPQPGDSVAAHGAAISTLATVIALDLACLTAGVCGQGHHPRMLIHDSPREAEMESVLFHAIFQLAATIESAFDNDRPPAFQYIITTSSRVPDDFAHEPRTRLILDARDDASHFLGVRF